MSNWLVVKLIAECVEIGANVYDQFNDRKLARENAERDRRIEVLERKLAAASIAAKRKR